MSNRLTFSLASLTVLLALGLVFVATPAMAATFATHSITDTVWIQGQPKIDITFPKATGETEDGKLTVTLTVNGTTISAGEVLAAGMALEGLTYASTVTAAVTTGDDKAPASAVGSLKGDNAHDAVTNRAIVVYTVAEETPADDDTDPDPITITFTVQIDEAPELMFPAGASIADMDNLIVGDAITTMVLPKAVGGVEPIVYTLEGIGNDTLGLTADPPVFSVNLPDGLTFTAATRLLTGTPSMVTDRTTLTYTVRDSDPDMTGIAGASGGAGASAALVFTVVVKDRPTGPSFAITKVDDEAYTKNHAITAMTLPEASDTYAAGALTYKLAPLPKGLMFDAATRMLTGTPTGDAGDTAATYTVTDASNNSAMVPFKITVNDVVGISGADNVTTELGSRFADITLGGTNGTGDKTLAVTGLPDGLMFDDKTKITGTPSRAAAAETEVTVTATDSLGAMGTAKFKVTVTKPKPLAFDQTGFTAAIAPRVFTVNQAIAPTVLPKGTDGVGTYTYALANVPAGLSFDENTRLLSGTPTTVQAAMDHTYTITDSAFAHVTSPNSNQMPTSITLPISITVNAATVVDTMAPTFGDATIAALVATQDTAIEGRVLPEATDSDSDADELTYTVESAAGMDLPAGLMFDDEHRTLTGTPTAMMAQTAYVYKVEDGDGNYDTITFFITVNARTVVRPPHVPTPTATLAAGGHVVYVRSLANSPNFGTANPQLVEWAGMPNLHELFADGGGGSLQLNVTGVNARQVVFSEVMWAVDEGKVGQPSYTGEQWIEIHNRTANAVPISSISFAVKADGRPALPQGTDLISNVVGGGSGNWIANKGQSGNSGAIQNGITVNQKEFISMYRKRYHNDSAGWNPDEWLAATNVYHPNHKGTPGRGESKGPSTFAATSVPLGVVFNEISNSSTSGHEWIELRIKDGNPHFENWVVDIVTGANDRAPDVNPTQRRLFKLPKMDVGRYNAEKILLITKTDPVRDDSHPLRGGYNIRTAFDQQDNEGRDKSIRYYVATDWNIDLPDSGEFVLILRNGADKTNHEKIVDIAGFHTNLKVDRGDFFSNLWPLRGYPAPGAAGWTQNKLSAGTVHRRQHDGIAGVLRSRTDRGNHADDGAFRDEGWKGVGYKRNAKAGNPNGGTPGYPNNALQSNETQAGADPVIISEIMYATGERGNIPQWIELRNTSQTVGVNLDGWRLTVVNHDQDNADGDKFPGDLVKHYGINGKISPGETFLIVAHSGTNNTNLPSNRIHAVFNKRGQHIMSQYGFELTLLSKGKDNNDANRKVADTVGNLASATGARVRANPQSYETPAWMLPAGMNDAGNRVSIVRVASVAKRLGQTKGAWVSFEDSAHLNAAESTYYGNRNDQSNPGYTVGGPLPVSLSKFRPERMKDTGEIVVRWITESETNNAGFNILRSEALDGEFTKLHFRAGQGTTTERTLYEWTDKSAKPNVVYYYQIQDVSLDGEVNTLRTTHLRGNVTAVGKATTTWGEIKALQ